MKQIFYSPKLKLSLRKLKFLSAERFYKKGITIYVVPITYEEGKSDILSVNCRNYSDAPFNEAINAKCKDTPLCNSIVEYYIMYNTPLEKPQSESKRDHYSSSSNLY